MKRLLSFILALCLLCGMGSALALDLPGGDGIDDLTDRISALLEDLDLREKLDDLDMDTLMADIKDLTQRSGDLSDEELDEAIRALAEKHGLSLDDEQIAKVAKLCRSLEKGAELKDKAADAKAKATGFLQRVRIFAHKAAAFFQKLGTLLEKV